MKMIMLSGIPTQKSSPAAKKIHKIDFIEFYKMDDYSENNQFYNIF